MIMLTCWPSIKAHFTYTVKDAGAGKLEWTFGDLGMGRIFCVGGVECILS